MFDGHHSIMHTTEPFKSKNTLINYYLKNNEICKNKNEQYYLIIVIIND